MDSFIEDFQKYFQGLFNGHFIRNGYTMVDKSFMLSRIYVLLIKTKQQDGF